MAKIIGNSVVQSTTFTGGGVHITRVQWYNPGTGDSFFKFTFDTAISSLPVNDFGTYNYQDTAGFSTEDVPGRFASTSNTMTVNFGDSGGLPFALIHVYSLGDIVFVGGGSPVLPADFNAGTGVMDATATPSIAF